MYKQSWYGAPVAALSWDDASQTYHITKLINAKEKQWVLGCFEVEQKKKVGITKKNSKKGR